MSFEFDAYTATGICEGFVEADSEEQVIAAWQWMIDNDLCWQLQGWFGRTAMDLINQGICHAKGALIEDTQGESS